MKKCKKCNVENARNGRHYCYECSPRKNMAERSAKRLNKYSVIDGQNHKWCAFKSHWVILDGFHVYTRQNDARIETCGYCKECSLERLATIRSVFKRKIVEYGGNRCNDCKGTFPDYVYDFHHLEPEHKDFSMASNKAISGDWGVVKRELDKCVLVCSNCHRTRHHS